MFTWEEMCIWSYDVWSVGLKRFLFWCVFLDLHVIIIVYIFLCTAENRRKTVRVRPENANAAWSAWCWRIWDQPPPQGDGEDGVADEARGSSSWWTTSTTTTSTTSSISSWTTTINTQRHCRYIFPKMFLKKIFHFLAGRYFQKRFNFSFDFLVWKLFTAVFVMLFQWKTYYINSKYYSVSI